MLGFFIYNFLYMHIENFIKLKKEITSLSQELNIPEPLLVAVTKKQTVNKIIDLINLGHRNFGENYVQEGLEKICKINNSIIDWHFIGPIQSNKTRDISRYFSWVHSVDRLKIAVRLNQQRPVNQPPLNICLQVNIDEEESKSGFSLKELIGVIEPMLALDNIQLRGLMAIPKAEKSVSEQRTSFKKLADVQAEINRRFNLELDTLSMGMSADLESAIAEGSTMVRIGTAIFGERLKSAV